jgi:hypothetical protein
MKKRYELLHPRYEAGGKQKALRMGDKREGERSTHCEVIVRKSGLAMRKPVSVASAARTTPYWPLVCAHTDASADAYEGSRPARLISWDAERRL